MTYTYYIYHIPGVKIGCTTDLAKRMQDQGFTNWEILWQQDGDYEFGWIAGENEIELQKLYDYKVDTVNYQISRQNRFKFDGSQRTHNLTFEDRSKGGSTSGKNNVESGHLRSIAHLGGSANTLKQQEARKINGQLNYSMGAKASSNKIFECPECGRKIKSIGGLNSHRRTHKKSL
jgi:hypothetical protein